MREGFADFGVESFGLGGLAGEMEEEVVGWYYS